MVQNNLFNIYLSIPWCHAKIYFLKLKYVPNFSNFMYFKSILILYFLGIFSNFYFPTKSPATIRCSIYVYVLSFIHFLDAFRELDFHLEFPFS